MDSILFFQFTVKKPMHISTAVHSENVMLSFRYATGISDLVNLVRNFDKVNQLTVFKHRIWTTENDYSFICE
jgi:hypothetical protein